jgi:cyclase
MTRGPSEQVLTGGAMQKISEHVYVFRDSRNTNLGLILTPGGSVLVDSPMLPDDARAWRAGVLALTVAQPLFLINTDHHLGHSLGNWAFADAKCITHRHSAFYMLEKYDSTFRNRLVESFRSAQPAVAADLEAVALPRPRLGVVDEMSLHVGDITVEMLHVGGHTPGALVVRVREDDVLFTGDVVVADGYPSLGDAHSQQWLTALDKIRALKPRLIVPGHGDLANLETLNTMSGYIQTLCETVGAYYAAGMSRKDVVSKVRSLESYPIDSEDRARSEQRLKASLQRVYDEFKERDKELEKAREE